MSWISQIIDEYNTLKELFDRINRKAIDYYAYTNRDGYAVLNALNEGSGQAIEYNDTVRRKVTDIVFYLQSNATFNGTLRARIYAIAGTAGVNGRPTGAFVAQSDAKTQLDLVAGSWNLVGFNFSTPYVLDPHKSYAIVVEMTGYVAGQVLVGYDITSPTHAGNFCYNVNGGGWVGAGGIDAIFYIIENNVLDDERLFEDILSLGALVINQNVPYTVKSDKDTHFTTAIAVNAKEDEDLTGLQSNKILITNVEIQAKENKHYVLWFWSKDTKDDTDLDLDAHKGTVDLDLSVNGKQIAGQNQYYMDVTDVNLHYQDEDGTKELHVSLQNLGLGAKTAGVNGEVKIIVTSLPLA